MEIKFKIDDYSILSSAEENNKSEVYTLSKTIPSEENKYQIRQNKRSQTHM